MKKINRFLFGSAVLTLSFLVSSSSFAFYRNFLESFFCPPDGCLRDGFYVGAGLGYENYRIRQDAFLTETDGTLHEINPPLDLKDWFGGLFGGYGLYFGFFYFGGEIFAESNNASMNYSLISTTGSYNTSLNVRYTYAVSLIPGFKVNPSTLIYARVGYTRTSFKIHENGFGAFGIFNGSRTQWGNGVNMGVGMETSVYNNVSLRADYIYTTYGSFGSELNTRFKPSDSQFKIDVIYHFAC